MTRKSRIWAAAVAAIGMAALAGPGPAVAAQIDVTTTEDEYALDNGACALREAITAANLDGAAPDSGCAVGSGPDTIVIPAGTYVLTIAGGDEDANVADDLDVTDVATLRPARPLARVVIDGGQGSRVLETSASGDGVRLENLTIRGGSSSINGGGIFNSGILTLVGVTVTANQTTGFSGGIANSQGDLTLVNTTVSENSADSGHAGIGTSGPTANTVTMVNSTVTGNVADADANGTGDGGGIGISPAGSTVDVSNSIVAVNFDRGGEAPDCDGTIDSSSFNLIGATAGCTRTTAEGERTDVFARLGPLALNGGPTATHALLAGSPALNAGDNETCERPDQRGVPAAGFCDMGAYERSLCRGVVVNRVGNRFRNTLRGTRGRDGFLSFGGPDFLLGFRGHDAFCAGPGNDLVRGGPGNDRVFGQRGRDLLVGWLGRDRLVGGPGPDTLRGGRGRDLLFGGRGRDSLDGGRQFDFCGGGPGRDRGRIVTCERVGSIP